MDKETLIAGSALISAAAGSIYLLYKIYPRFTSPRYKSWPRNVAIVFHIGKGPGAPALSPFALKLMTYLRMAGIPYQTVGGRNFSSKGKVPWVIYNGIVIEDSEFIIRYFNENLKINLNKKLSNEESAASVAFRRLVEEHLFWIISVFSEVFSLGNLTRSNNLVDSYILAWKLRKGHIRNLAWWHGIGRHTNDELLIKLEVDLTAISKYLGDKAYFMGEEPSEVDCTVFGFLAQILWHMPNSHHQKIMTEELPNLQTYCERMRNRFWPDWDEKIAAGTKGEKAD